MKNKIKERKGLSFPMGSASLIKVKKASVITLKNGSIIPLRQLESGTIEYFDLDTENWKCIF